MTLDETATDTLATKTAQALFLRGAATPAHHEAQHKQNPDAYASEIVRLVEAGVELTSSTRVRAAAVCWRGGQRHATDVIMMKQMNVSDVLSLAKLLDAERQLRALDKKLARVTKRRKVAELTQERNNIVADGQLTCAGASATSSFAKRVRRWVQAFKAEKLVFYMLNFSLAPWCELADITHLRPADFALPYFLPVAFGAAPPEDSVLHAMRNLTDPAKLPALLKQFPVLAECYSFLRTHFDADKMSAAAKKALALAAPLSDLVWFYEEMEFPGLDDVIKQRMLAGEAFVDATGKNRDNFGKLMERLLLLRKKKVSFLPELQRRAESLLEGVCVATSKKVAVLGDASASMQVAVESATIIGSVACTALQGELSFFNNKDFKPPVQPRTVADVLRVTDAVRAGSATAPAASLMPFLNERKFVDLFIVVTDEEENSDFKGQYKNLSGGGFFADMFKLYLGRVNPQATVFFVSFLKDTTEQGQMMRAMAAAGLAERCQQFRFHPDRPDLSKLGSLLAILAEQTQDEPAAAPDATCGDESAAAALPQSCEGADVPVFCQDGTLLVTEAQLSAVQNAFTDVDTITVATLLRALPKLRISGGAADDNASVSTSWTVVSGSAAKRPAP